MKALITTVESHGLHLLSPAWNYILLCGNHVYVHQCAIFLKEHCLCKTKVLKYNDSFKLAFSILIFHYALIITAISTWMYYLSTKKGNDITYFQLSKKPYASCIVGSNSSWKKEVFLKDMLTSGLCISVWQHWPGKREKTKSNTYSIDWSELFLWI